jgi:hypothetical protein
MNEQGDIKHLNINFEVDTLKVKKLYKNRHFSSPLGDGSIG